MELLSDSIQSQRANIQRRDFPQFIRNPLSRLFMGTPFRKPFFILFQASLLHFWFPPIRGGTISIACFANHARLPKGHAEWDISQEQWQTRRYSMVLFRPDGKVSEREDHYSNGSVSRS